VGSCQLLAEPVGSRHIANVQGKLRWPRTVCTVTSAKYSWLHLPQISHFHGRCTSNRINWFFFLFNPVFAAVHVTHNGARIFTTVGTKLFVKLHNYVETSYSCHVT
jgi:hypothetical protein